MDEKKTRLIIALKKERDVMVGKTKYEASYWDVAIAYLETGSTDKSPDDYELLESAMNDYETLCNDYLN